MQQTTGTTELPAKPETHELILWTGPKHSGKTATLRGLIEAIHRKSFAVAGLLAPSIHDNGRLLGFDAVDVRTGARAPLARLGRCPNQIGRFNFLPEGLNVGASALSTEATRNVDLVIVDEFGPLELAKQGWRNATDRLVQFCNALILIVVRQELTDRIAQQYQQVPCRELLANEPDSIAKMIALMGERIPGNRPGKSPVHETFAPGGRRQI